MITLERAKHFERTITGTAQALNDLLCKAQSEGLYIDIDTTSVFSIDAGEIKNVEISVKISLDKLEIKGN